MSVLERQGLLEREVELSRAHTMVGALASGSSGLLVIEGPPGIGKTALLEEVQAETRRAGLSSLSARAGPLEQDLGWGLTRRLFDDALTGASPSEREDLLDGAAALSLPAVGTPGTGEPEDAGSLAATLHGLFWLSANLAAARGPLLFAIDDAHWADAPSLRWLSYLVERLDELPVLLVLTLRPVDPEADHAAAVQSLRGAAPAEVLSPAPLSEEASVELVRAVLGSTTDAELCRGCHEAVAGNPYLLRELVRELANEGSGAIAARDIERITPGSVSRAILLRLARLPPAATALARAVSILGAEVPLPLAAKLAGIDEPAAAATASALAGADILKPQRPLDFVHPIVRTTVLEELPAMERSDWHAHAARLLEDVGAPATRIALQLLAVEARGDAPTVAVLREAAAAAIVVADPEGAATYLRRAVGEPPSSEARADVLLELGRAEAIAGSPAAAERLQEALVAREDPGWRSRVALELSGALITGGRADEGVELLDAALARAPMDDDELRAQLEAARDVTAYGSLAAHRRVKESPLSGRLIPAVPKTPGQRLAAAARAMEVVLDGPASKAATLAERALGDGALLAEVGADSPSFYLAAGSLFYAGRLEEALAVFDAAVAAAQAQGSVRGFAMASTWRAVTRVRRGELAEAEADARASIERREQMPIGLMIATSAIVDALVERGDLAAARSALPGTAVLSTDHDSSILSAFVLTRRARLLLAEGDPERALDELGRCEALEDAWGVTTPSVTTWRATAALAALSLERTADAARFASEGLQRARRFGADGPLAEALRIAGLVEGGDAGVALLREAVAAAAGSAWRLEHAHALFALGSALRRAGRRGEAREPLRQALDLADRCGAKVLCDGARAELVAAGARPRRDAITGRDALTASERRIAGMAAEGMTNRQIAQALFLSLRTVETHLTHTYGKLDVSSRGELAHALDRPPA